METTHSKFAETFYAFCGSQFDMNLETFTRLCESCFLLDEQFTSSDVDAIFAQVASEGRQFIELPQFEVAMQLVAKIKDFHVDTICQAVMHLAGPTLRPTCAVVNSVEEAPLQFENGVNSLISCV